MKPYCVCVVCDAPLGHVVYAGAAHARSARRARGRPRVCPCARTWVFIKGGVQSEGGCSGWG